MHFDRGDVVLVMFPDSNLRTAKRRPALVVQIGELKSGLPQTIVAMISSNLSRADHASRVKVMKDSHEGQQMGLRLDSIVMTDNIATILNSEVDRAIGSCENMAPIDDALRHTLGL